MGLKLTISMSLILLAACSVKNVSDEKVTAFDLVKNSLFFKELDLKCDSIAKINSIPRKAEILVVKQPMTKEDSINHWQTVFLQCTDGYNEETLFTIKVDIINKRIAKSSVGDSNIK